MSARLEWRPVKNDWKATAGQSAAKETLSRAFDGFPETLAADALPVLRGIFAADPQGPWKDLIEAIERHGQIELQVLS